MDTDVDGVCGQWTLAKFVNKLTATPTHTHENQKCKKMSTLFAVVGGGGGSDPSVGISKFFPN